MIITHPRIGAIDCAFITGSTYFDNEYREITTCVLRAKKPFAVAFGSTIRHPHDFSNRKYGERVAFKRAAEELICSLYGYNAPKNMLHELRRALWETRHQRERDFWDERSHELWRALWETRQGGTE